METSEFIRQYANDDVRALALMGKRFPKVDLPYALDQIRGRQLARTKLPTWANTEGIVLSTALKHGTMFKRTNRFV